MINSKKVKIITAVMVCFALLISILMIGYGGNNSESKSTGTEPAYATKVFGKDIISIQIIADEKEWQEMLSNARAEEYIKADVIVNGTKFTNVGIRPKGNSSLTQVASSGSNRYSFHLQFDKYIKEQTCFGLKSFVVNNMLGDNTYMKEYVSYDLMKTIGVKCPYFGYSNLTVNNKPWGLYLAVELYNDSYEQRTVGDTSSMLYNVKSMDRNDNNDMTQAAGNKSQTKQSQTQTTGVNSNQQNNGNNSGKAFSQMPGNQGEQGNSQNNSPTVNDFNNRGGMPGGKSTGGTLQYSDDNISSYSAIFGNVVGKGTKEDYQRVITALKALSTGTDLEKYYDVDEILRYLAAHTIVVNLDSYSSSMAQNYYICEKDGKISILPWDYNLAWGGFQSGSASSVINFPIDTPVSGVEMSDRPLLEKLFANDEYRAKYHQYLQELIDSYFADGKFEAKVNTLNTLIADYVKNDKTAFCTYEQYQTAVNAFKSLGNLRAESVQGQLSGTVPSTTAEQQASSDKLVSAGNLNLSDLGSMGGGVHNNGQGKQSAASPNERQGGPAGSMPDMQLMRQAMQIIQQAGGTVTDDVKKQLVKLGLTDEQITMISNMPTRGQPGNGQDNPYPGSQQTPNQPGGDQFGTNGTDNTSNAGNTSNTNVQSNPVNIYSLVLIAGLLVILAGAIIFAAKYKRNY